LGRVEVPAGFDVVLATVERVEPIDQPGQTQEVLAATAACGATIAYPSFQSRSLQEYLDKLEALSEVQATMSS
jgi:hypothetical protein